MLVIGITGSIGMGKSTVCGMLRRLGVAVHDADAAVHRLMAPGGAAVAKLEAAFPGVTGETGGIDRARLRGRVVNDPVAFRRLERIIHPLVGQEKARFLRSQRLSGRRAVALDIPLLFETGGERQCDKVMVVSAPVWVQRRRVLSRPGMTVGVLRSILSRQMPDARKRLRADAVVFTGGSKGETFRSVRRLLRTWLSRDRVEKSHA